MATVARWRIGKLLFWIVVAALGLPVAAVLVAWSGLIVAASRVRGVCEVHNPQSGWPDLLAMGTHARSRLATDMIGNLARHMLAEAYCDVLVARP